MLPRGVLRPSPPAQPGQLFALPPHRKAIGLAWGVCPSSLSAGRSAARRTRWLNPLLRVAKANPRGLDGLYGRTREALTTRAAAVVGWNLLCDHRLVDTPVAVPALQRGGHRSRLESRSSSARSWRPWLLASSCVPRPQPGTDRDVHRAPPAADPLFLRAGDRRNDRSVWGGVLACRGSDYELDPAAFASGRCTVARLRRRGPLRRGSSIGYCGRGRFLTRRRPYWLGPTREYYPAALAAFGTDLAGRDALAVLTVAPSPELCRRLSQSRIETLLRRAGRQRNISTTAATIRAADALSSWQLV